MSGVFGVAFGGGPHGSVAPLLESMGSAMRHLPWHRVHGESDDTYAVGLGHVGIGVIDPEPQPVSNAERSVTLVMAGEFYDRERKLGALADQGAPGAPGSDATLALKLYLAKGPDFVRSVEGMFAIAVWNRVTATLLVVNDRFGLVSVYYARTARGLAFAPELKAVLRLPDLPRRLNETALAEFVRYQQLLGEKTFFEGVTLMPPACMLTYDVGRSVLARRTYWDGSSLTCLDRHADPREVHEETVRLVDRAVEVRLGRSSRPGLFLSGGLDSRMILAVARPHAPGLTALTYGHPDSRDVRLASRVAKAAGVRHVVHPIADGTWVERWAGRHFDLVEGAHSWMHAHGMSALPEAREVMDVCLSGVAGVLGELFNKPALVHAPDDEAFVQALQHFYAQQHAWPGLTAEEERTLYTDAYASRLAGRAFESLRAEANGYRAVHPQVRGFLFNLHNHSRRMNHYLVVFGGAYVGHRCPYFDYALTNWVLSLPLACRAGKQLHVAVLRATAPRLTRIPYDRDYRLPTTNVPLRRVHAAIDRMGVGIAGALGRPPRRRSLPVDYENYLRGELRPWAESLLLGERAISRGIFREEAVRSLLDRHLGGHEPWVVGKFNALITIEMLMRTYFDSGPEAPG